MDDIRLINLKRDTDFLAGRFDGRKIRSNFFNSLTPMGARERPLNNGLRGTVVSRRVFIRSQSLIAR